MTNFGQDYFYKNFLVNWWTVEAFIDFPPPGMDSLPLSVTQEH